MYKSLGEVERSLGGIRRSW
jgi:hypothetical protein